MITTISPGGYVRTSFRRLPDDDFEIWRDFLEERDVQTLEVAVAEPALLIDRDLGDCLEKNLRALEGRLRLYVEGALKGRQFRAR